LGTSTDAHCFACGYDTFLILGAGMMNFTTNASWPVSCKVCSAITTANFEQTPLACEACNSTNVGQMTDPHEWNGDGDVITSWGDLTLTSGHYRCPKCDKLELRFGTNEAGHQIVLWD
jgi:hypothetical protein